MASQLDQKTPDITFRRRRQRPVLGVAGSTVSGVALGGLAGAAVGGPVGAVVGMAVGGAAGFVLERQYPSEPERDDKPASA